MTAANQRMGKEYQNLTQSRYFRMAVAGLVGTLALLAYPVDSILDQNLTLHMFQHFGLFFFSAIVGYGLEKTLITKLVFLKKKTYVGWKAYVSLIKFNHETKGLLFAAVIPLAVFSFWHYPANFDLAVTNGFVHVLEHFSYIVAGGFLGAAVVAVPRKFKALLLVLAFMQAGMMGSMMLVWPHFFTAYSSAQNSEMDLALMLFGAVGLMASGSWFLKVVDVI
jgi:cytochrome c oxidase assembly factor CtaG